MSDSDEVRKGILSAENRVPSTFVLVLITIVTVAAGILTDSLAGAIGGLVTSVVVFVVLAPLFAFFIWVVLGTAIFNGLDGFVVDPYENFVISFFISGLVAGLYLASARTFEEESDIM
jgi:hypothetical protein